MKRNLDVDPICINCENAIRLCCEDECLCRIYGVVYSGHSCRKFIFDPLKLRVTPRKTDCAAL